ncbi:hypothetical protein BDF19DRAFT_414938 [Syncephalis fuscata]|nr:hypothetical protein BDF19DRAFT_418114 [Syncephalis fuscata]KAI9593934.1 hypothetical protein BDF19DRAFT_414938 [Syncephalis fuscata]
MSTNERLRPLTRAAAAIALPIDEQDEVDDRSNVSQNNQPEVPVPTTPEQAPTSVPSSTATVIQLITESFVNTLVQNAGSLSTTDSAQMAIALNYTLQKLGHNQIATLPSITPGPGCPNP